MPRLHGVLTATGPSWSNAPKGSHTHRTDAICPGPLGRKMCPLEIDAGVPMVITICLRIPQERLQKINHKETYHDIHTFERYYWQM
jgi:hypothetical protein